MAQRTAFGETIVEAEDLLQRARWLEQVNCEFSQHHAIPRRNFSTTGTAGGCAVPSSCNSRVEDRGSGGANEVLTPCVAPTEVSHSRHPQSCHEDPSNRNSSFRGLSGAAVPSQVPLSEQLRHFHDVCREHECREAADALSSQIEIPFARARQLMDFFQLDQRRARQGHQLEVLRLEEAILQHSLRHERSLNAQLQDMELEWDDLEVASAQLRLREERFEELSLSSSSFSRPPRSPTRAGTESPSTLVRDARAASEYHYPEVSCGHQPLREFEDARDVRKISQKEIEASSFMAPSALAASLNIPPLYQEAVTLVLEYGWAALHGGNGPLWTSLHWAAMNDRSDVVAILLGARADPMQVDEIDRTPLDYALHCGHSATASLLQAAMKSWISTVSLPPPKCAGFASPRTPSSNCYSLRTDETDSATYSISTMASTKLLSSWQEQCV